ncbi:DUF805 domain-containing protein [Granulicatella sp. zg-ZJ]|uniref:DUF805 domain-containing protein n=1 Tax=Granulicatella sp. zg-ZJ TaxID=2678504 RepID=UPI0013D0B103|nr:DUF805 domain-containing protein [Granulicatella sp. zg-ZJ]NEW61985.1 DUF805 domain-containing protein [Granulicatella sp. zg-ZJ]
MAKIDQRGQIVPPKQAINDFFKGYFDFTGYTTRAGYLWVALISTVFLFVLFFGMIVSMMEAINSFGRYGYYYSDFGILRFLFSLILLVGLFLLIPFVAIQVRRLRDSGFTNRGIVAIYLYVLSVFPFAIILSILTALANVVPALFGIVLVVFLFAYYFSWIILGGLYFAGLVYPTNGFVIDIDNPVLNFFFRRTNEPEKEKVVYVYKSVEVENEEKTVATEKSTSEQIDVEEAVQEIKEIKEVEEAHEEMETSIVESSEKELSNEDVE